MKTPKSRRLTFYSDVTVEAEVNLSVQELYGEMDDKDIQEFLQYAATDGFIDPEFQKVFTDVEDPWSKALRKLALNKVVLTLEEEQIVLDIANKLP